ncbi:MAG: DNA repair protein RecO [Candidatus Omnitrophota bacterium]
MIQTTNALILRSSLFRETSQILTFLTQDFGKIHTLAKGARRGAHRFGSTFELFTCNRIVFYERRHSELQLLSQCDLVDSFPAIRADLKKTAYAVYFSELVDRATAAGDRSGPTYTLFLEALREASQRATLEETARIFEAKFLSCSGWMPEFSQCLRCRGALTLRCALSLRKGGTFCERCSKGEEGLLGLSRGTLVSIRHLVEVPWELAYRMRMSRQGREELKETLKRFIDYHIDEKIMSRDFLKELEKL